MKKTPADEPIEKPLKIIKRLDSSSLVEPDDHVELHDRHAQEALIVKNAVKKSHQQAMDELAEPLRSEVGKTLTELPADPTFDLHPKIILLDNLYENKVLSSRNIKPIETILLPHAEKLSHPNIIKDTGRPTVRVEDSTVEAAKTPSLHRDIQASTIPVKVVRHLPIEQLEDRIRTDEISISEPTVAPFLLAEDGMYAESQTFVGENHLLYQVLQPVSHAPEAVPSDVTSCDTAVVVEASVAVDTPDLEIPIANSEAILTPRIDVESEVHIHKTDIQIMQAIGQVAKNLESIELSESWHIEKALIELIESVVELKSYDLEPEQRSTLEKNAVLAVQTLLENSGSEVSYAEAAHFIAMVLSSPEMEIILIDYKQLHDETDRQGTRERKPTHFHLLSRMSLVLRHLAKLHEKIGKLVIASLDTLKSAQVTF